MLNLRLRCAHGTAVGLQLPRKLSLRWCEGKEDESTDSLPLKSRFGKYFFYQGFIRNKYGFCNYSDSGGGRFVQCNIFVLGCVVLHYLNNGEQPAALARFIRTGLKKGGPYDFKLEDAKAKFAQTGMTESSIEWLAQLVYHSYISIRLRLAQALKRGMADYIDCTFSYERANKTKREWQFTPCLLDCKAKYFGCIDDSTRELSYYITESVVL